MKSYGLLERTVAKYLEAFPAVRNVSKTVYHRLNYLYFSEKGFQSALHPQVQLRTPAQWAETEPESGELFFGYYDKSPWSPDMTQAVFHRLQENQVEIKLYNCTQHSCQTIGVSSTWNYQQGSMTQWLPGSERKIIFNDLVNGKLAASIVSPGGGEATIPWPVQVIHPSGKEALAINYKRLDQVSEYGYAVAAENFRSDLPTDQDGIWLINLETGQGKLLIDLATLMAHQPRPEMADSEHQINHLVYSPQGKRFIFMHRWTGPQGRFSRMYVANADGSDWRLLMDDRMVSHYSWRDEEHLLTWARIEAVGDRYYLINVVTGEWQIVGDGVLNSYGDGHPSYSPDRRWIVTDTYPNRARQRTLLLYEVATNRVTELGRFLAPWQFDGDKRCDLHPRWSPNGQMISIDSAHEGRRMTYMLDVSAIIDGD
ncbi:MAG: TolB family protein [Cyanophyceae cyanobacterium]